MELTAKILREKFEKDLEELRNSCPHIETQKGPYYWRVGSSNGTCKWCLCCEKILEHYPEFPDFTISTI